MIRVSDPFSDYDGARAELDLYLNGFLPMPNPKSLQAGHLLYLRDKIAYYESRPKVLPFKRPAPGTNFVDTGDA